MSDDFDNIKFDKLIQQKYAEHENTVPKHLWINIDNAVSQRKITTLKKRLFWYRWITASLVIILIGTIVLYSTSETENKNVIQISKTEATNKEIIKESIVNSKIKNTGNLEKTIKLNAKTTLKKSFGNVLLREKAIKNTSVKYNSTREMEALTQNKTATANSENNEAMNNPNTTKEKALIADTQSEKNQIQQKENGIDAIKNDATSQEMVFDEEKKSSSLITETETTTGINKIDSSISTTTDGTSITNTATFVDPIITAKIASKISVSLLFNSAFSSIGFNSKSNSNSIYNSPKNNQLQFSAGANVGYQISTKFTLKLGVEYRKFKNEFKKDNARPNELPILINPTNNSITINSSLGAVMVNDVGEFNFAGDDEDDVFLDDEDDFASLNYKEEQSFILLDLPLKIDYAIGKRKLKLVLEGGLLTSIVINNKSKIEVSNIYSPEMPLVVKNFHNTKKITLSGMISAGLKYDLSNRISLLLLPGYSTSFMNINNDKASEIKPSSINLYSGVLFHF